MIIFIGLFINIFSLLYLTVSCTELKQKLEMALDGLVDARDRLAHGAYTDEAWEINKLIKRLEGDE